MHQIFYLSFIAARGSTLEGLKNAVEFFDKLQSESQNINSFGAEEAGILVPIVGMLIKLYAHTLPPIQKKFAFDYLKLEQGKFQIALSTKMAKENNIKMETDHDYEGSSAHFSDQGRYTPFLSRQVDDIMKSEIPKEFERSFVAPRPRDTEGKTSIIKNFPREETRETPSGMNVLEKIGMQTPKPDPKFLSIQKRDHLLDDHHHEDIVFSEQDEDISAGKATVSKWMTNLKNKNDERKNYRTQDPLISVSKETPFVKKRGYGDMDLIDSFRGRKPKNVPSSSPSQGEKEPQDFRRITKESLLAGLPDRVLNLSTKDVKQEKNEEDKEEQKSEVNSDVKYAPSSSNRDVEMDPDDSYKSSQNHNNSIKEEIEQIDIDDSENYGDQQESDIAVEDDIVVDPSPAPSSKNLDEVSGMSPSGNNISHEAFGHQEPDIDFDPDPESLIIPRKSSSSEKKSSSSEKKSSSSEKKSSSSEKKSFSREKESSRQKGNSQEGEDNINDNEANDDNEDNEDADMQPAELSSIHLSTPPKKRRMSFEMQKQNLFEFPSDQQNDYEFELLGDPNTHDPNPVGIRPRWSKANDDIELEKRKKIAKRKRIMGFLYGGNMPHLRRNTSKYKDINVGSDHSPAKDLESQQLMSSQKKNELERISSKEELSSKGSRKHRREEDKEHNEEVERDDRIYSEQVYNQNSSFNSKASNRNIGEATRSQAQAIMMEDRVTDSANLLEKVKRVVQQDNVKEQADNLDVVQEESSERSVVSGIVISSNNSQAAPPANDGEPDIVFEALSSKSGENKNSQSNGSQNQNESSPMRTRAQAVISKNKRKKYQGKKRKF